MGILIFLFAFLLRILVVFLTNSHISPEVWEYETIATNFLNHKGFVLHDFGADYYSYIEPLYPAICVAVYFLTGHSYLAIEIVQAAASAFVAVLTLLCGKRLNLGSSGALLAAALVAVHPGMLVYTAKLHPCAFDALLMTGVFLAFLVLSESFSMRNVLLSGFLTGLCFLTKPVIIVFALMALAYTFKVQHLNLKKAVLCSVVWLFCVGIALTPLVIRNYVVYNKFLITRSTLYYTLWIGNNPYSSDSAVNGSGRSIYEAAGEGFMQRIEGLNDELQQNKRFRDEALSFIKSDPAGFINRTARRFFYFWWFTPQGGLFYPERQFFLYKMWSAVILLSGIYGMVRIFRGSSLNVKRGAILVVIYFLSVSLAQSVFYVEGRHRLVIEPLLMVFTARAIVRRT